MFRTVSLVAPMFHVMVTLNWLKTKKGRKPLHEYDRRVGDIDHRLCAAANPCWDFPEKWPLEGDGGRRLPHRAALGVAGDRIILGPNRVADVLGKNPVTRPPLSQWIKSNLGHPYDPIS